MTDYEKAMTLVEITGWSPEYARAWLLKGCPTQYTGHGTEPAGRWPTRGDLINAMQLNHTDSKA